MPLFYMYLYQMPIYHVLEQGKSPSKTTTYQDTPTDKDVPLLPRFNPDSEDIPFVQISKMTSTSSADVMYDQVGIVRDWKTSPNKRRTYEPGN